MANTYYVASSGSSGNSGLSTSLPKDTWAHAMSAASAGDTILGNGGDVFREQITLGHATMTLGSYGTGQAVISGANVITGWATATAPRYSVSMTTQTNIVFVNDVRAVKGGSATTLNNGEWFWLSNVLYYRSDAGNPDTLGLVIEAGQRDYALTSGSVNGFTLTNLCLQRANADESGAYLTFQPNSYLIDGCTIQDNYGAGVHVNGTSTSGTVQNSAILNNGTYGIWWSHTGNLLSNALTNTISGNGWRTDGAADFAAGIGGNMTTGTWAFNTIFGNGAGGQILANAHGIYLVIASPTSTLQIHDNVCFNHVQGNGIKADSSCTIYNNVCHDNTWQGIELGFNTTAAVAITAHHNTCYNNGRSGVSMQRGGSGTGTLDLKLYHNTLYKNCTVSAEELSIVNDFTSLDIRNNIIVASPTANFIKTYAGFTGTKTIDYNCYSGGNASPFRWGGLTQAFAAYKTSTGFDSHSVNADPKFVSP